MFLSTTIFIFGYSDINKLLIQDGDIIFQNSNSSQSKAIELATKSKYTHMGIIFKKNVWMCYQNMTSEN